jgi:hypothetical protein
VLTTIRKNSEEEIIMKKILCVAGIVMLFAAVVYAGGITKADLKNLKGTYEGYAHAVRGRANLTLEILNDAEPVKGKVMLTNIDAPAKDETAWAGDVSAQNDQGKVTNKGTIMFTGAGGNFFEITSMGKHKDGKLFLEGWFYANGAKVDWSATKK